MPPQQQHQPPMPGQMMPPQAMGMFPQNPQYSSQPTGQMDSPQDVLIVRNIDVDCSDESIEVIDRAVSFTEPGNDIANRMQYGSEFHEWNHAEYFEVRYDGQPFRIAPGATRMMPRYIAEHYAKHLADHILGKQDTKKKTLVNNAGARAKVLSEIILRVEQYYQHDTFMSPGQYGAQQVEQLNKEDARIPAEDMGIVDDLEARLGKVAPPAPELPKAVQEAVTRAENQPVVPKNAGQKPGEEKTRDQLIAECVNLGIDVKGTEKKDDLIAKLQKF